jgi:D-glycero-D-manno-heptose 1,7-bisphosphate phosphatase
MRIAVFLERDGVLNNPGSKAAPRTAREFEVNHDVIEPLRILKDAGFLLNLRFRRDLPLDDILVCPHEESDSCPCRKPSPGLFQEASFKWHIDLDRSYVISDKWQDSEAARQVGCVSLLLDSPTCGTGHHDYILPDIESAFERIVLIEQKRPMLAEL